MWSKGCTRRGGGVLVRVVDIMGLQISQYQFEMSNNMVACNQTLHEAYRLMQRGMLRESIQQYQLASKNTYNQTLKNNIKCTIALLHYHLTRENTDQMLHSLIISQNQEPTSLITIRAITNCILIDTLEGRGGRASDYFDSLLQIIQQEASLYQRKHLLQYICYLLFRVRNFQEMGEFIENMDLNGLRVEQVFSISVMAFNSEICKLESQERVQRLCYEQFIKAKRYDLAIFSLRALVKFTKNSLPNKQYYERQLGKLIMLGYFNDNVDYQNYEAFEAMQAIADKFIAFSSKLIEDISKMEMKNALAEKGSKKGQEQPDAEIIVEWKYTIAIMMKQLGRNKDMEADNKRSIIEILEGMKAEENILVIRSMVKNNYFAKYHEKVHSIFQSLSNSLINFTQIVRQSFKTLKNHEVTHSNHETSVKESTMRSRLSLKSERSKSNLARIKTKQTHKQSQDKQNQPLGISIVSIASSKISNKQQGRRKIFEETRTSYACKKVQKMMKMCEHGGFLNKRNFNSEGGEYRFVKITNSFIKWGKDPEKIESNCQIYPLKDIKSIVYGRVSPNLNQNCNKMLSYSKCFSLLLQKRTLDFYCKNYEELEAWVCGLSAALKKQQLPIVGYSPGKLRWKKMFAILKENFITPLKAGDKHKYYYENAYSLILFAKNGYQLRKGQEKQAK